eukprot:326462-Chlamydomonas_euryale.AAC.1
MQPAPCTCAGASSASKPAACQRRQRCAVAGPQFLLKHAQFSRPPPLLRPAPLARSTLLLARLSRNLLTPRNQSPPHISRTHLREVDPVCKLASVSAAGALRGAVSPLGRQPEVAAQLGQQLTLAAVVPLA